MKQPATPKAPRPQPKGKKGPEGPDGEGPATAKLPEEKLPDEYKKLFVKKTGYANYYFNQQEQQRVLRGLDSMQSWKAASGKWKLTGKTVANEDFSLTMSDTKLGLLLPNRPGLQSLENGADFLDEPPGSGGLLAALQQLKLLLTKGPEVFTEFSYVGSQPLDGRGASVDVLLTRKGGVETLWYFRKADATFVGFDSSLGTDVDACEIRFLQFGDFAGKKFPSRFTIRHGDADFATFDVLTMEVGPAAATEGAN